jgi:aryl-alcohol dehydrogenase-like predicted oxidoreductase
MTSPQHNSVTPPGTALGRRDFLRLAALFGAGSTLAAQGQAPLSVPPAKNVVENPDAIPLRRLGRADVRISALGCGGHHLGDFDNVDDAIHLVQEAVDGGITFFDNCWEYWNGKTENLLGRALQGRRDKVFVMTKVCTHGRSARLAMEMLEASLRRLQTDHLDLWQIHGVVYDNDPELAYAKGGVLEALDKAKRQGKTRFVGFTGHKDPAIHLRMIQMGYGFDTVQMPLNPFDANFFSFEKSVLPEANRRGIAVLGMKSMGGTAAAVKKGIVKAEELLRYAMSLPVATTISGMDSFKVLRENLKVAQNFQPLSPADMEELRRRCATVAADGRFEPYKVSLKFDNQMTRMPHGFPIDKEEKEVQDMFQKANGGWEPVGV